MRGRLLAIFALCLAMLLAPCNEAHAQQEANANIGDLAFRTFITLSAENTTVNAQISYINMSYSKKKFPQNYPTAAESGKALPGNYSEEELSMDVADFNGSKLYFTYSGMNITDAGGKRICAPVVSDRAGWARCKVEYYRDPAVEKPQNFSDAKSCGSVEVEYGGETIGGYDYQATAQSITLCPPGARTITAFGTGISDALANPNNMPFCLPALLVAGMLLASMYYASRDPLSLFDITTPRLPKGKPHKVNAGTAPMMLRAMGKKIQQLRQRSVDNINRTVKGYGKIWARAETDMTDEEKKAEIRRMQDETRTLLKNFKKDLNNARWGGNFTEEQWTDHEKQMATYRKQFQNIIDSRKLSNRSMESEIESNIKRVKKFQDMAEIAKAEIVHKLNINEKLMWEDKMLATSRGMNKGRMGKGIDKMLAKVTAAEVAIDEAKNNVRIPGVRQLIKVVDSLPLPFLPTKFNFKVFDAIMQHRASTLTILGMTKEQLTAMWYMLSHKNGEPRNVLGRASKRMFVRTDAEGKETQTQFGKFYGWYYDRENPWGSFIKDRDWRSKSINKPVESHMQYLHDMVTRYDVFEKVELGRCSMAAAEYVGETGRLSRDALANAVRAVKAGRGYNQLSEEERTLLARVTRLHELFRQIGRTSEEVKSKGRQPIGGIYVDIEGRAEAMGKQLLKTRLAEETAGLAQSLKASKNGRLIGIGEEIEGYSKGMRNLAIALAGEKTNVQRIIGIVNALPENVLNEKFGFGTFVKRGAAKSQLNMIDADAREYKSLLMQNSKDASLFGAEFNIAEKSYRVSTDAAKIRAAQTRIERELDSNSPQHERLASGERLKEAAEWINQRVKDPALLNPIGSHMFGKIMSARLGEGVLLRNGSLNPEIWEHGFLDVDPKTGTMKKYKGEQARQHAEALFNDVFMKTKSISGKNAGMRVIDITDLEMLFGKGAESEKFAALIRNAKMHNLLGDEFNKRCNDIMKAVMSGEMGDALRRQFEKNKLATEFTNKVMMAALLEEGVVAQKKAFARLVVAADLANEGVKPKDYEKLLASIGSKVEDANARKLSAEIAKTVLNRESFEWAALRKEMKISDYGRLGGMGQYIEALLDVNRKYNRMAVFVLAFGQRGGANADTALGFMDSNDRHTKEAYNMTRAFFLQLVKKDNGKLYDGKFKEQVEEEIGKEKIDPVMKHAEMNELLKKMGTYRDDPRRNKGSNLYDEKFTNEVEAEIGKKLFASFAKERMPTGINELLKKMGTYRDDPRLYEEILGKRNKIYDEKFTNEVRMAVCRKAIALFAMDAPMPAEMNDILKEMKTYRDDPRLNRNSDRYDEKFRKQVEMAIGNEHLKSFTDKERMPVEGYNLLQKRGVQYKDLKHIKIMQSADNKGVIPLLEYDSDAIGKRYKGTKGIILEKGETEGRDISYALARLNSSGYANLIPSGLEVEVKQDDGTWKKVNMGKAAWGKNPISGNKALSQIMSGATMNAKMRMSLAESVTGFDSKGEYKEKNQIVRINSKSRKTETGGLGGFFASAFHNRMEKMDQWYGTQATMRMVLTQYGTFVNKESISVVGTKRFKLGTGRDALEDDHIASINVRANALRKNKPEVEQRVNELREQLRANITKKADELREQLRKEGMNGPEIERRANELREQLAKGIPNAKELRESIVKEEIRKWNKVYGVLQSEAQESHDRSFWYNFRSGVASRTLKEIADAESRVLAIKAESNALKSNTPRSLGITHKEYGELVGELEERLKFYKEMKKETKQDFKYLNDAMIPWVGGHDAAEYGSKKNMFTQWWIFQKMLDSRWEFGYITEHWYNVEATTMRSSDVVLGMRYGIDAYIAVGLDTGQGAYEPAHMWLTTGSWERSAIKMAEASRKIHKFSMPMVSSLARRAMGLPSPWQKTEGYGIMHAERIRPLQGLASAIGLQRISNAPGSFIQQKLNYLGIPTALQAYFKSRTVYDEEKGTYRQPWLANKFIASDWTYKDAIMNTTVERYKDRAANADMQTQKEYERLKPWERMGGGFMNNVASRMPKLLDKQPRMVRYGIGGEMFYEAGSRDRTMNMHIAYHQNTEKWAVPGMVEFNPMIPGEINVHPRVANTIRDAANGPARGMKHLWTYDETQGKMVDTMMIDKLSFRQVFRRDESALFQYLGYVSSMYEYAGLRPYIGSTVNSIVNKSNKIADWCREGRNSTQRASPTSEFNTSQFDTYLLENTGVGLAQLGRSGQMGRQIRDEYEREIRWQQKQQELGKTKDWIDRTLLMRGKREAFFDPEMEHIYAIRRGIDAANWLSSFCMKEESERRGRAIYNRHENVKTRNEFIYGKFYELQHYTGRTEPKYYFG